ncbi:MAG: rRNA maturation RNase YbeY [bacterium]|nr:rRNA maturation RNase YbeY [bacterium]
MNINISGRLPAGITSQNVRASLHMAFRVARRKERGSISVRFVRESEISKLNRYATGKTKPTDVLSFSSQVSPPGEKEWGDIFIASSYAIRQADQRSISRKEEMIRLLIHGTLHLLGYDHRTRLEEKEMFGKQERGVHRVLES